MPLGDAGAEDLKDSLGAVGAGGRVEPRALAERSENGKDSRWKELFRRTGQKTQGPDPGEITNASVAWGAGLGGGYHPPYTYPCNHRGPPRLAVGRARGGERRSGRDGIWGGRG